MVHSSLIPRLFVPKTIKIDIHSSLLDVQQLKGQCAASAGRGRQVAAGLEDQKVPLVFPGQYNLLNKL